MGATESTKRCRRSSITKKSRLRLTPSNLTRSGRVRQQQCISIPSQIHPLYPCSQPTTPSPRSFFHLFFFVLLFCRCSAVIPSFSVFSMYGPKAPLWDQFVCVSCWEIFKKFPAEIQRMQINYDSSL